MIDLQALTKVHMVGIGGIGVSALAKYLLHQGVQVTGSDARSSKITHDLVQSYDISFSLGAHPEMVTQDLDMLVYSPAIPEHHPERQAARDLDIPEYSYPEIVGVISSTMQTIAIAGTNGKTTTSSMVVELLKHLGADPTAIVGAFLQKYKSNFVAGSGELLVTETCEYKDSFLHIHHDIVCITNISEDHLDYFRDLKHIQESFMTFLENKKGTGIMVCNTTQKNIQNLIDKAQIEGMTIINYGKYLEGSLELALPGEHNKENAAAALGIIEALGLSIAAAREYLAKHFQGAERRMERVGSTEGGALLFDDYAHNPEGIEHLIDGLRDYYPEKKIVLLFEPHLYSRTRDFKNEFGKVLEKADVLFLFPTYRAREEYQPEEEFLLENFIDPKKVELHIVKDDDTFPQLFKDYHYGNDTIVVTAGAGLIWQHGRAIKK